MKSGTKITISEWYIANFRT